MAKVSVIVPIYNPGKKLEKCITSILNQTFKEYELILVNDGSVDNSLFICQKYQKKDSRIIVIDKKNAGSIATRRKGVEASKNDYIMFVDADDWIDPSTIEILYNETIQNDLDIAVCNMFKTLGSGKIIKIKNKSRYFFKDKIYDNEQIKKELVVAYFHGHPFPSSLCAKLYKKELLASSGNFLERIRFLGDDLFYNLEVFMKARRVKVIDKALYYYRQGGFTSKYQPFLFDDMVNGYLIQKEVIDEYYQDTKKKQYAGISIMLLNTFKTCLQNLHNSKLSKNEIESVIQTYVLNDNVKECLCNEGSIRYFPSQYLDAIRNKDIEYLYKLGKRLYKKAKPRKALVSFLAKIC